MVFFENTKRLALEFLAFKKYKQMNTVLAVFVGIFMIPFFVAFAVQMLWTFISAIFFTIVEAPIKFLHKLVKDETENSHLAFKIVIYYLSWPIIFAFYVSYAMMLIDIFVSYVFAQAFGYVASLGGFKFHITPLEERIEAEVDPEQKHNKAAIAHIIVCSILLGLGILTIVVFLILMFALEMNPILMVIGVPFISLIPLFELVYACIAYRDRKGEKKEEPKQVEEKAE